MSLQRRKRQRFSILFNMLGAQHHMSGCQYLYYQVSISLSNVLCISLTWLCWLNDFITFNKCFKSQHFWMKNLGGGGSGLNCNSMSWVDSCNKINLTEQTRGSDVQRCPWVWPFGSLALSPAFPLFIWFHFFILFGFVSCCFIIFLRVILILKINNWWIALLHTCKQFSSFVFELWSHDCRLP